LPSDCEPISEFSSFPIYPLTHIFSSLLQNSYPLTRHGMSRLITQSFLQASIPCSVHISKRVLVPCMNPSASSFTPANSPPPICPWNNEEHHPGRNRALYKPCFLCSRNNRYALSLSRVLSPTHKKQLDFTQEVLRSLQMLYVTLFVLLWVLH
jgi:hypothetical protein